MNVYLLMTALRACIEPQLATLPLSARQRHTRPEPGQETLRPATVHVGRLPAKEGGDTSDAPFVLIQSMHGYDEEGCSYTTIALRVLIWSEDGEAGENDLQNLVALLRRAVLACRQQPLDGRYVLEPDERGRFAFWDRPDEQPPHFAEAYVLTNWKMQGLQS
ncbi:hypothetical protein [Desulfovibrio falkowii]|uniref:hypothetical protein n=1 Tax=Desulfovibrio sp. WGS1351 TaxID=3366814 RepID=UPI00372D7039